MCQSLHVKWMVDSLVRVYRRLVVQGAGRIYCMHRPRPFRLSHKKEEGKPQGLYRYIHMYMYIYVCTYPVRFVVVLHEVLSVHQNPLCNDPGGRV